jgi:glycosyltransferase involved in cell wall biosynthesis
VRLLAIASEFPLPLDRGGPVRFTGLLRALAAGHHVDFLTVRRPSTTEELRVELESGLGGTVEVFDPPPSRTGGIAAVSRWAQALRDGVPPWIEVEHSRELERRAIELARVADAVVLLNDYAGVYAHGLAPLAPVIADKSNVMGATAADEPALPGARGVVHRALAIHLSRRFERGYLRRASAVLVTSAEESARLERLYGRAADAVVPSAVDLPAPAGEAQERAVGWLGTHEYPANVDGLVRFVSEGWEALGRAGARLLIAGAEPPAAVRQLERYPGVEVLGYVEDLNGFLGGLAAAVTPLWKGAGVKVKTLTFMGAGLPLVATPVAMEGVEVENGRHCLIANRPDELAGALQDLLDDHERAARMGAEARRLIAGGYTWETVGPRFREAVERAARARS